MEEGAFYGTKSQFDKSIVHSERRQRRSPVEVSEERTARSLQRDQVEFFQVSGESGRSADQTVRTYRQSKIHRT